MPHDDHDHDHKPHKPKPPKGHKEHELAAELTSAVISLAGPGADRVTLDQAVSSVEDVYRRMFALVHAVKIHD